MEIVKFTQPFGPFRVNQVAALDYVETRISQLGLSFENLKKCVKVLQPNRFKSDQDDSMQADDLFIETLRRGLIVKVGARAKEVYSLRELMSELRVIGLSFDYSSSGEFYTFMLSHEKSIEVNYNGRDSKAGFVTIEKISVPGEIEESFLETIIDQINHEESRFFVDSRNFISAYKGGSDNFRAGMDAVLFSLTGKNFSELQTLNKSKNE